jgi:hypothetical protein
LGFFEKNNFFTKKQFSRAEKVDLKQGKSTGLLRIRNSFEFRTGKEKGSRSIFPRKKNRFGTGKENGIATKQKQ